MSETYKRGVGRLATDRYDFHDHTKGTNWRHEADQVDVVPPVTIGSTTANDVQTALEAVAGFASTFGGLSQGFVAIGDGYDTYHASDVPASLPAPNEIAPYDSTVPELNFALDDLLNNVDNPGHHRVRDGGIVLIKAGTYKFTDTVNVPPGITILGEGWGTKIINAMTTAKPLFKIKQDVNRTADKSIESAKPFIYNKETIFWNITIADNFVLPKFLGDVSYKVPKNTSESTPLILAEAGSNFTCDKVKFVGKTIFTGSAVTSLTSMPIAIDNTLPVNTGTILTIRNCEVDGFSILASFLTRASTSGSAAVTSAKDDYLTITNNRMRLYGLLNNSGVVTDGDNNAIVKSNAANISISNNYILGADAGSIGAVLYLRDYQSGLTKSALPKIILSNNHGAINKAATSFDSNFDLIRSHANFTSGEYFHPTAINNSINSDTINFADTFTFSGSSQAGGSKYAVNLGSYNLTTLDDSRYLKTLDAPDWDSSILKSLNARYYITVGDGSTSVGDFNGSDAIHQAITWVSTYSPFSSARIYVKGGAYNCDTTNGAISIPGGYDIIIEGTSPTDCAINGYDGTILFNNNGFNSKLTLKNLTLASLGTPTSVIATNLGAMEAENCHFYNSRIEIVNPKPYLINTTGNEHDSNILFVKKSSFIGPPGEAIIKLSGGLALELKFYGFKFDDCSFQTGYGGHALLMIAAESSLSAQVIYDGLEFNRCDIALSDNASTGGTDFDTDAGVIGFDLGTATLVSGKPPIVINSILYKDCKVRTLQSGGAPCLIHLIPVNNATSSYTTGADPYVQIKNFTIDGGSWLANPDYSALFNPFTIATNYLNEDNKVSIKNVSLGFTNPDNTSVTHGGQTQDSSVWFGNYTSDTKRWGWAAITARHLHMNNVKFVGMARNSDSGDLFAFSPAFNVDDLIFTEYNDQGSGNAPLRRVYLVGAGQVKSMKLIGTASPDNGDWAYDVSLAPSFITVYPIDSRFALLLEDTFITNFSIDLGSGPESSYAYGISVDDTQTNINRLIINRADISDCRSAFLAKYTGTNPNMFVNDLTISNCRFTDNRERGIEIILNRMKRVNINNNYISENGTSSSAMAGIYLAMNWYQAAVANTCRPHMVITNNSVYNNGSVVTNRQIELRDTGSNKYEYMVGTIMGNDCSDTTGGSATGSIVIKGTADYVSSSFANADDFWSPTLPLVGVHTGFYITAVVAGDNQQSNLFYKDGAFMMNNKAVLKTTG